MTRHRAPWALLALSTLAACGGANTTGKTTSAGTGAPSSPADPTPSTPTPPASPSPASPGATGLGFDAKSAIHGVGPDGTTIVVSDAPDLCAALAQADACGAPLGTSFLRLTVGGKPPGTFSGAAATALLVAPGRLVVSAGDGRVDLGAESSDGLLSGSFDLGASGVSGQLTTQRCAALDAAGAATSSSSQSCTSSFTSVNGRTEFDGQCACGAKKSSRQCTLGSGDSAWSCQCTAASGAQTACQAPAQPGALTPPANCCPTG